MPAVITLTCDRELLDPKGKHSCGFQQTFQYPSCGEAMAVVASDGWRKAEDQWHCPECAANDTADLEDEKVVVT